MSSTSRGAIRSEHDYYVTPPKEIVKFLLAWMQDAPARDMLLDPRTRILDPCAGGNKEPADWIFKYGKDGRESTIFHLPPTEMSYPKALRQVIGEIANITTMDIRENSPAKHCRDYLNDPLPMDDQPHIVISNPPFLHALDFIRHSLAMVPEGGYVVMLLRLNFFGSAKRKPFFAKCMPMATYVHHERMGFTPDGKTDSIEYMHAVWRKGWAENFTQLRVI